MGEDPEQLEREIERTRAKLGADIDALEEKVNPKKVAHRQVETAKGKAAELKDKVVEAAGVAKEKVAGAAGDAKDKVAEVNDKATGSSTPDTYPTGRSDRSSGGGIGQKVAGVAGTVKEKAAVRTGLDPATTDTRTVATAFAGDTWSTLREQTVRNPLAVAAAALLLGFLIGR